MTRPETPTLGNRLAYWSLRLFGKAFVKLPTGLAVNIGGIAGAIAARFIPVRRQIVDGNLRIAFGDTISNDERRRLVRETYRQFGMFFVESLYICYGPLSWVEDRIAEREGWQHVEKLIADDRPFLMVGGHIGNWELAGAILSHARPVAVFAKPMHNRLVQQDLSAGRERHGLGILWTDGSRLFRELLTRLKGGGGAAIMVDQDQRTEGIFVPFFGRLASTTAAPALLALRQEVPIVPTFSIRLGPTRHRLVVLPPILPESAGEGTRDERIERLMTEVTRRVEDMVRLYPTQYFWFHRRWKTTPEAARKRLAKLKARREAGD